MDSFKEDMFKHANVSPLTEKQKEEIKVQMDEYVSSIKDLNEMVDMHSRYFNQLESIARSSINKKRPVVANAEYIHDECGIAAAIYFGTRPSHHPLGGANLAYCLYCDKEYIRY